MKHRIQQHLDTQKRCGIPEDHVVIDKDLYQALIFSFGSHFDDSTTELSQQLSQIRRDTAEIKAAVNRLPSY